MSKMKWYDWIAYTLITVGAINWGLTVFNFNLVNKIFGSLLWLENGVYLLVGLAGIYSIYTAIKLALNN